LNHPPLFADRVHVILGDYHKYWLVRGLVKNPKANLNTKRMMDLKEAGNRRMAEAVRHFGTPLAQRLGSLVSRRAPTHFAIVPGHEADSMSEGLNLILNNHIRTAFNVVNRDNVLRRHTSVESRAKGGTRDVQSILDSVEVKATRLAKGATIVLLDDVMTSGTSLEGCERLLLAAGATTVIPIALLRTADA
jgi:predicted amidophosphoribosyltransferase